MSSPIAHSGHPGVINSINQQNQDTEMQQEPVNIIAKLLSGKDAL
jgi:hypothetical protein